MIAGQGPCLPCADAAHALGIVERPCSTRFRDGRVIVVRRDIHGLIDDARAEHDDITAESADASVIRLRW